MQDNHIWNQRIFGIRLNELGAVLLFYTFFASTYYATLYLTSQGNGHYTSMDAIVEYGITALLTLPIWWLIFKKFSHLKIWHKIMIHLLVLPFFLAIRLNAYYLIADYFEMGHLSWPFAWWDVYIPFLFYVLQFGIFHVYEYHSKLREQQRLEGELRELALKSELTALKAQLNPHFLYNTFNTISASVPPKQERTREMIAKLSDLFRYQLKGSKMELVPLEEEIEFVKTYLELEKERFEERLQFHFEIDERVVNSSVPPMILQPLVENAVKHGISPKIDGGEVVVRAMPKEGSVEFEVCDSGLGLQEGAPEIGNGVGLSNTKLRLEKMYQSELELIEKEEGGVCVKFRIPD